MCRTKHAEFIVLGLKSERYFVPVLVSATAVSKSVANNDVGDTPPFSMIHVQCLVHINMEHLSAAVYLPKDKVISEHSFVLEVLD